MLELNRIQNLSPAPPTPEGISVHTPLTGISRNTERSVARVITSGPVTSVRTGPREDLAGDAEDVIMFLILNDPYYQTQSNGKSQPHHS